MRARTRAVARGGAYAKCPVTDELLRLRGATGPQRGIAVLRVLRVLRVVRELLRAAG